MTARATIPAAPSALEETFAIQLRHEHVTGFEREFEFAKPARDWRFDFAWPAVKVAVEIQGYGHQRDNRYYADQEKFNAASRLGWCVLCFSRAAVMDWSAVRNVRDCLASRGNEGL